MDKSLVVPWYFYSRYMSVFNDKSPTAHTLSGCRGRFRGLSTLVGKCGGDDGRILGDFGAATCCLTEPPFPPDLASADS